MQQSEIEKLIRTRKIECDIAIEAAMESLRERNSYEHMTLKSLIEECEENIELLDGPFTFKEKEWFNIFVVKNYKVFLSEVNNNN